MKVALVSKAIYPARGGVELHVHSLARELVQLGHQVQAFTAAAGGRGFQSEDFSLFPGMKMWSIYGALRQGKFDVLHAHGARTTIACWALLAAKSLGMRTMFTPHCFYPAQDWRGRLKRRLFDPTIGRMAMRRADGVICLTENDRRDAVQYGAADGSIHIIPNSIRVPIIPADERVAEFCKRYGLATFLLSVGRLDRVKNGVLIIRALPHLPAHLQLVFIGPDAGCMNRWKAHAKELGVAARVRFLSEVRDDELLLAYRASAAVVMASSMKACRRFCSREWRWPAP